ncbi:hypothetical protein HPP92_024330 [Vanilla planifolia]|uniref:BAT2 N-terminal domain-containing protein n=1 Tax=Vanilla planifolia TaxID=51239 RepID=A0A835PLS2_VANPL|nr:hypothetical protein HPP92_024330 [Vanilla planifolia]
MASSERRWASSRKSGMTVLGKVPRPINLPSQKLENHGLDPNVEIVPKGTLTWGSKPLIASNAWASSSCLSLQSDGSVYSSINASFRPSSGGSTTCTSTAGNSSDRNAWVSEGTSGRLDVQASKASDFSFSSIDFPSLGSEKNFELKSLGHETKGLPAASENEKPDCSGLGNFNSWKEDSQSNARQVGPTSLENLQRDHPNVQLQYNTNMPSQRGSWGGHHVNPPDRLWCGVHETDGLYRPLGTPGGYPIDPYYPCLSARELPVRAFVRPDVSSQGHHSRFDEACRGRPLEPHVGSSKVLIGGTPGIYPSPALLGGYGPHVNNGSSYKRDVPVIEFSDVEAAHYQYSTKKPGVEHGWFHSLPDGNSSTINKEHMVSGQAYEIQGKSEILLKPNDGEVDTGSKEEQYVVAQSTQHGENSLSLREKYLPGKIHTHEQISKNKLCEFGSSQLDSSSDPGIINFSTRSNTGEHNMMQKPDASSIPVSDVLHNPTCENTASLMENVESLNGKARSGNIHSGCGTTFSKEKKIARNANYGSDLRKKVGLTSSSSSSFNTISDNGRLNTNSMNSSSEVDIHVSTSESKPTRVQSEQVLTPAKLNSSEISEHSHSCNQKKVPNLNENIGHRSGLKFGGFDVNKRDKVPVNAYEKNSGAVVSVLPLLHCHGSQEAQDGKDFHLNNVETGCETYVPIFVDAVDHEVQRAKLKELARQRASELQNEEEERTRVQKAKAKAKLEELNMRTEAISKHNPDLGKLPCCSDLEEEAKFDKSASKAAPATIVEETSDSCCGSVVEKQENYGGLRPGDPVDVSFNNTPKTMKQPFPLAQGTIQKITKSETAGNLQDNTVLRLEQVSFRGRQNIPRERSQAENATNLDFSAQLQCGSAVSKEDPSFHPKKKNSRGPKLKHKLTDSHPNPTSQSSVHPEGGDAKGGTEDDETKPVGTVAEVASISHNNCTEMIECQGFKDSMVVPVKEVSVKASSDWKPHPQKKPARNQYKTNAKHPGIETAVWTPVKVSNKNGPSEEVTNSNAVEATDLSQKNNKNIHNGSKAKKAEMERHIPKNIIKELSRDTASPSLASMLHADMPDKVELVSSSGVTGRDDRPAVVTIGLAFDNRNTESTRPNRRGKSHVLWRQRNSVEPTLFERSAVEGNFYIEKNSADNNGESAVCGKMQQEVAVSKMDNGLTRQRRHQFRESKIDRSSSVQTDDEELHGDLADRNGSHFFPTNSGDKKYSRTPNQNLLVNHTEALWQLKSQIRSQTSLGRRVDEGQRNAENVLPSQNVVENVDESVTEVKDTHKQKLMIETTVLSEHSKDKTPILKNGLFCSGRDSSFIKKQSYHFGRGSMKDGLYKTESNDKPCVTEAATETLHRPFSMAKYGNRGHNPPRHGGPHFYVPHRRAATRINGE